MRYFTVIFAFTIATLIVSCLNPNKQKSNSPNNPGKEIVYIPNVFPDEGLTDPHVLIEDDCLYLFCGHDKSWDTENTWKMDRWEIHSTDNLTDWHKEGEILPTQTYIGDQPNCWAGDITKKGDKYYWYFSNKFHSTGVMVADSPAGPWIDALGKPLLPEGIIGKIHPYDPAIYEEKGVYTIFFGAGFYHAATLAEDMISLASDPQPVKVYNKKGKEIWTADKPTVFKRDSIYYLVWGPKYGMSKNLYGPYIYEGAFLKGGHNDVFQWKGQWYAVMENKDISLFYRGISLKPLYFNKDGTIHVPLDDEGYPARGRKWTFKRSRMGWRAQQGTSLEWDEAGYIKGSIKGEAIIESAVWAGANMNQVDSIVIKIRNLSGATKARIGVASLNPGPNFWEHPEIDWSQELKIEFNIAPKNSEIQELKFKMADFGEVKSSLKRLRIEPSVGVTSGSWEVHYFGVQ